MSLNWLHTLSSLPLVNYSAVPHAAFQPPPNPTEMENDVPQTDALHNMSLHNLPEDIITFDPTNPIPSTLNDPLYNTTLQPIGQHPDYADPSHFQIDFESLSPTTSSATTPATRTSSPTAGVLPQHSLQNVSTIPGAGVLPQHSLQSVSTVTGAGALQQHPILSMPGTHPQPIIQSIGSPSSTGELSPTDTFTSVISDSDTDTTQVESPQNPDHSDNTKARNIKIKDEVMQKFLILLAQIITVILINIHLVCGILVIIYS